MMIPPRSRLPRFHLLRAVADPSRKAGRKRRLNDETVQLLLRPLEELSSALPRVSRTGNARYYLVHGSLAGSNKAY